MAGTRKPFRIEMTGTANWDAPPSLEQDGSIRGHIDRIFDEICQLRASIDRLGGFSREDVRAANAEPWAGVDEMQTAIATTRQEIAALRAKGVTDPKKNRAADELDAVVADTESATESILAAAESIDEHIARMVPQLDGTALEIAEQIQANVIQVFEACNFQDISGQRISKVVTLLKFIEVRLSSMESVWQVIDPFADSDPEASRDDEQKLLNGPALADELTVSQDDIDSLFN